jgi:hypothetical protein
MIYNLGHVTDSLKRCVILEQAGQFDMKEYFYRKFYS